MRLILYLPKENFIYVMNSVCTSKPTLRFGSRLYAHQVLYVSKSKPNYAAHASFPERVHWRRL